MDTRIRVRRIGKIAVIPLSEYRFPIFKLPKRRIETEELSPLGMLIGYIFLLMRMVAYTLACRPACRHTSQPARTPVCLHADQQALIKS
ncbi:hypothetical protein [Phocaeicola massiliensis]|uniref:hypothetical protein n=1 Tax=Phocaeicola massiliensis TaxID=204516 RepID=UPI0034A114A9